MLGGLARRVAYVKGEAASGKTLLVVDSGNLLPDFSREKDRDRAERIAGLLIRAYELMGADAVNVGFGEASFGLSFLKKGTGEAFPWVSSNILDKQGKPVFNRYILKDIKGMRFAFIGLAGSGVDAVVKTTFGSGHTVADPVDSARKTIADLSGRAEVIVLLAAMTAEETRNVVEKNPGICFVIGGEGEALQSPSRIGKVPLFYAGTDGQYAGSLNLICNRAKGGFVDMGEETRLRREIDRLEKRTAVLEKAKRNRPSPSLEKMIAELETGKSKLKNELNQICACASESGKFTWNLVPMVPSFAENPEVLRWLQAEGLGEGS